ncbi:MAG: tripartite tricarboxylate transporter substrate binding protein [Rubritepida sp.]|nr:tripartite tricarboxylate transporter substrate binding protein [Rubritepida sp.]MCU0945014.1 tripartite tricarboxylate transporter substrate binding protein [Rubritepida sp.]
MPVTRRRTLLTAPLLAAPGLLAAQSLPAGTVRMIVPYPPGGITDTLARGVSPGMTANLGQSVVVENRPGANGSIGAAAVARAPADGLTLLVGVTDTHAVNPAAMRNIPYDANADFAPVGLITRVPLALAVGPTQREVRDLPALIALAKARPGALTFSSWGVGSTSQIAVLRIGEAAGFEMLHVPFTGAAPAQQALLAGQVDCMVMPAGAAEALARDGRVRVLAVLSPERLPLLPEVPTLRQAGVDLSVSILQAIFAPARTPAPVVARLNAALLAALATPTMAEVLRAQAALNEGGTPEALGALVRTEQEAWGRIVRTANIRLD